MNEDQGPDTLGAGDAQTGPGTPGAPNTVPPPPPPPAPYYAQQQPWPGDEAPIANRPPSPNVLTAYWETIRHPSAEGMASEVPGASWSRILLGVAAASLISVVFSLLQGILLGSLSSQVGSASRSGTGALLPARTFDFGVWLLGAILTPVAVYIGFFLGTLFLYWLCRIFGGVGRTGQFGPDFKVLSYLLSLIAVPISVINGFLSLIPVVGSLASLGVSVYSIVLQYYAIRAAMQMSSSKAQRVIITLIIVGLVLGVVLVIIILMFLAAEISSVFGRIGSGLR